MVNACLQMPFSLDSEPRVSDKLPTQNFLTYRIPNEYHVFEFQFSSKFNDRLFRAVNVKNDKSSKINA